MEQLTILTVHLFAAARDLAGSATVQIQLAPGATITDLRQTLSASHPKLAGLLTRSRIAIDHEFAEDGCILEPGAEVAVIPPVSGG